MSGHLKGSTEIDFRRVLFLMQEGKINEALMELERADKAVIYILGVSESEFSLTDLQINFN
jgi:hypothetical protein